MQRLVEALFFLAHHDFNDLLILEKLGIDAAEARDHRWDELEEERFLLIEFLAVADRATKDSS